ncbi:MAG: hypothetical protein U0797_09235 [Gemmataceae bacterium]
MGHHFYAMQFIDGRTLAQVLAARHEPADADATANYADARPAAGTVAAASTMDQAKGGRPTTREVARLGVEAAARRRNARTLGIVHRDVKPEQPGAGRLQGKVWVTDFGLARQATNQRR